MLSLELVSTKPAQRESLDGRRDHTRGFTAADGLAKTAATESALPRHWSSISRGRAPATDVLQAKPNTTGLPDKLKAGVERLSGYSLDDVRVHYNSAKPAAIGAHAYARGADIHVAPGQEQHLPHEAWHIVQQKQGRVKPTLQMKGVSINTDSSLEGEADLMGHRALTLGPGRSIQDPGTIITPSTGELVTQRHVYINWNQPVALKNTDVIDSIHYARNNSGGGGHHFVPHNWINSIVIDLVYGKSVADAIKPLNYIATTMSINVAPPNTREDFSEFIDNTIDILSNNNNNRFPADYKGSGDERGEAVDIPPNNCPNRADIITYGHNLATVLLNSYKAAGKSLSGGVQAFLQSVHNAK